MKPFLPKERGVKRADDRKMLSGIIIHVNRKGLRWVDDRQGRFSLLGAAKPSACNCCSPRLLRSFSNCS